MDKPFIYRHWNDPDLAFEELGKDNALETYRTLVEPSYADESGYKQPEWEWRKRYVMYRDRYRCLNCGKRKFEGELVVHHTEHLSWKLPSPNRLEKLKTLCRWCHKKEHPDKFMRC